MFKAEFLIERVLDGEDPTRIVQEVTTLDVEVGDEVIVKTPKGKKRGTVSKISDFRGMLWLEQDPQTKYPFSAVKKVISATPINSSPTNAQPNPGDWVFIRDMDSKRLSAAGQFEHDKGQTITISPSPPNVPARQDWDKQKYEISSVFKSKESAGDEKTFVRKLKDYFNQHGFDRNLPQDQALWDFIEMQLASIFGAPSDFLNHTSRLSWQDVSLFLWYVTGNGQFADAFERWLYKHKSLSSSAANQTTLQDFEAAV